MPSRNVAVQKNVYEALDRERRPGESFTKLFARLLAERGALDELTGSWGASPGIQDHRTLQRLRGSRRRA